MTENNKRLDQIIQKATFERFMRIYNTYKNETQFVGDKERFLRGTRILNKRVKYELFR